MTMRRGRIEREDCVALPRAALVRQRHGMSNTAWAAIPAAWKRVEVAVVAYDPGGDRGRGAWRGYVVGTHGRGLVTFTGARYVEAR
jgi:hypothetical protein